MPSDLRPAGPGARVQLLFPPLVESNFGSVYPATAVLAGFLESHEIACGQIDLNEEFAEHLLSPTVCAALAAGRVDLVAEDSRCASVARWADRNRTELIDRDGRHHFGAEARFGWLMQILAQPFSVDPDVEVLGPLDSEAAVARFYADFYAASGFGDRIPEDTALIGICVAMGPQLLPSLLLARFLERSHPDARIVVGGPAISLMAEPELDLLLASHRTIDAAVRYDGEFPLFALARQALDGEWAPDRVPGASCRTGEECLHVPPGAGPNLNLLPRPSYSRQALARLAAPTLSIAQARGCYWGKCDYCDFVELYEGSGQFRGRRAEGFTDEVEWLAAEFGVNRFSIVTESIPPAFARRMSQCFLDRGLKVTWSSFAMVDRRFDRELFNLMVQAGCEFLVIGLETMITRVLKLVHKSADREENIRFLQEARQAGIRLRVNLIPDLPSTTYAEAKTALADIEQLADCLESVSVFPFEATRSSKVGRSPEQFGLVALAGSDAVGQSQFALNHLHNSDPAMTPEERREIHALYRGFARRIGTGQTPEAVEPRVPDVGSWLRVPTELVDAFEAEGRLVCTHFESRQRIALPAGAAAALLRQHLDGEPFQAGTETKVLRKLAASRLVVPVSDGEGLVS